MSTLKQVLADRQQEFSDTEKAQARANIGASQAGTEGITAVSHDDTLTGNGAGSALGVKDYSALATTSWVNSQGYITAQGAELSAGRGIRIADHVISSPSSLQATTSTTVGTATIELPITSQMQIPGKGSWTTLQQAAQGMGPTTTLYLHNYVPTATTGTYGIDNSGVWQPVLKNGDAITASMLTVSSDDPDQGYTAKHVLDKNGDTYIYSDDLGHTTTATIGTGDVSLSVGSIGSTSTYSLTSCMTGVSHGSTLTGNGKDTPMDIAQDVDHRGVMKWVNAITYDTSNANSGLAITAGNSLSTPLYTSTTPMSGAYLLSWGALGSANNMWGNNFFVRVDVGPDWGKASAGNNYAYNGYDWFTRTQGGGSNDYEQLRGSTVVYLTGQTAINISMYFCSAWSTAGTPAYVNGSWGSMSEFHSGHFIKNVWCTLDKVGPYAGPRTMTKV